MGRAKGKKNKTKRKTGKKRFRLKKKNIKKKDEQETGVLFDILGRFPISRENPLETGDKRRRKVRKRYTVCYASFSL